MRRQLRRHGRFVLGFALPLMMLVSAAVVYVASVDKLGPSSFRLVPREEGESGKAGSPLMSRSARAMPDSRIEGDRMGYPDDHLSRLAYPADDVRLEWIADARNAFGELAQSSAAEVANGIASWTSLGPESAVYQETQFRRFYYNPSRYVSSGRVTALAIAPRCTVNDCRLWVAAAGGGIWRTDKALSPSPKWDYLTANIPHNAIGAITIDPHDATGNTIWVGTGEPNSSGDSAAGVGLLRSTDGGDTWSAPLGSASFAGRAISSIVINPVNTQIMYVGTTRGVRGIAATTGGAASLIPGAALWGLYKSTDGGTTWTYVHNGAAAVCTSPPIVPTPLGNLPLDSAIANGFTACSPRGVHDVALDPL
ncbi:MAG TPA: sialidase family protein, partial [Vicinamibacterales bacterium]|nr:sialidase family protein [Vicinamibacterales bacterium]